jgi:hypothetical protein
LKLLFQHLGIFDSMMKLVEIILVSVLLLIAAVTSEMALARGGGGHGGGGGGGHGGGGGGHSSGGHAGGGHSGGGHGHNHGHGSHGHHGVFLGGVAFGFGYYYPPSYYYTWPDEIPNSPPGYIEQGTDLYYCTSAQSYYPDVAECPEGWQAITPEPIPPPP